MAYRDPKVTTIGTKNGTMRWIWIALAALVALLILWWLYTAYNEPVVTEGDPVVVTEPAEPAAPVDPAAPAPATPAN